MANPRHKDNDTQDLAQVKRSCKIQIKVINRKNSHQVFFGSHLLIVEIVLFIPAKPSGRFIQNDYCLESFSWFKIGGGEILSEP